MMLTTWRGALHRVLAATVLLGALGRPAPAGAQCIIALAPDPTTGLPPCRMPEASPPAFMTRRDAVNAGVNVALGALTAGVRAWRSDRPVLRAALVGAAGGAVAYGGKRVIAGGERYGGLVGRQLGAVGTSMVRNAGDGRSALAGLVLPLGPVRLYVNEPREDGRVDRVQPRLDLAGAVAILTLASRPGASIDFGASLEAGAPVVVGLPASMGPSRAGTHRGGVIGLAEWIDEPTVAHAMAHELVHVAQYDFTYVAMTEPLERGLWRRAPAWLAPVGRYVDLGLNQPVWALLNGTISYHDRPWEREAYLMTERGKRP